MVSKVHKDVYGYYRILGLTYPSSYEEIKKNYRIQAKKFHPDINKSSNSGEYFQHINMAYSILIDSKEKKNYDSMCMEFGEYDHEKEDGERRSGETSKQNEKNYSDEDVNKFNRMMERELRNDVISNIKIRVIFVFLLIGLLILIFAMTS